MQGCSDWAGWALPGGNQQAGVGGSSPGHALGVAAAREDYTGGVLALVPWTKTPHPLWSLLTEPSHDYRQHNFLCAVFSPCGSIIPRRRKDSATLVGLRSNGCTRIQPRASNLLGSITEPPSLITG